MQNKNSVGVIIPAAGSGARMGGVYKPLEILLDKPMLCYSLETFEKCEETDFVVISAREDKIEDIKKLCDEYGYKKVKKIVAGGNDRQTSVKNAFECGLFDDENVTFVAIHDAARPLLSVQMAKKVFAQAFEKSNAVCACKVRDTVKRTDSDAVVNDSVDRDNLYLIQTPQTFAKQIYKSALENAVKNNINATDDSSLVSEIGEKVYLCDTPSYNIKITYPEDVFLAEAVLMKEREKE